MFDTSSCNRGCDNAATEVRTGFCNKLEHVSGFAGGAVNADCISDANGKSIVWFVSAFSSIGTSSRDDRSSSTLRF